MENIQKAMHDVSEALEKSNRFGREIEDCIDNDRAASPMLIQWYEDALEEEKQARVRLGKLIESEKQRQLHAAYLV